MRKTMAVLTAVFLLLFPQVTVLAEESIISAKVPDEHKIEISAEHAEAIYQNEQSMAEAEEDEKIYMVERFSKPEFELKAKDGYKITKVLLGNTDITDQVQNGYITLPEMYEDQVLTIETIETEKTEKTEETEEAGAQNIGKGKKESGRRKEIKKKIRAAVTGDVAKCGVTTCVLLGAAGVAVTILKKKEI